MKNMFNSVFELPELSSGETKSVLGATNVQYIARHSHLAIIDSSLADKA